jgi:biliverdin reductase
MALLTQNNTLNLPVRVGIVGTGFAAKRRAEALQADERSRLVAVSGHTPETTQEFAQDYTMSAVDSWTDLVVHPEIDLVIVCTINLDHGMVVRAALNAGKHVIVEYPLSLDPHEAESLIVLAETKGKLLHVEHIELLGGLHQALREYLPKIGKPFYARYVTINPEHPAPKRWTYHPELYGFPLTAALSRIHRLTDLFGKVSSVSCQSQFWYEAEYFTSCLCTAQLRFVNSLIGEVTYGKGEAFWQPQRTFEVQGEQGTLLFESDRGILIQGEERIPIEVAGRRGLFSKDMGMVLDYLISGKPLYVSPAASGYALKVADAARLSAQMGKTVILDS